MKYLVAALFGTVALTQVAMASAEQTFRGVMNDQGRYVPVTLMKDANARLGERAGRIRFGAPWQCQLELEFAGVHEQVSHYGLPGSAPGRCVIFDQGYVQVSQDGETLHAALFDAKNKERFILNMAQDAK